MSKRNRAVRKVLEASGEVQGDIENTAPNNEVRTTHKGTVLDGAKRHLQPWKPGQSGNPGGRPKSGNSWSDVIRQVSDWEIQDLVKLMGGPGTPLGRMFADIDPRTRVKTLLVARTFAALFENPSSSLLDTILDRDEGKVPTPVNLTQKKTFHIGFGSKDDDD